MIASEVGLLTLPRLQSRAHTLRDVGLPTRRDVGPETSEEARKAELLPGAMMKEIG